uniref:Uncharacterized protein n=1 Tax=Arsenophonus endosymbiont of Trialeurodes vaporariorum TaxID=235567 RepID=A0A3B0MH03_9GAMM
MEKWQQLKSLFAEIKNTVTDLLPDWIVSEETKTLRAKQSLTVLNAGIKGADCLIRAALFAAERQALSASKALKLLPALRMY